MKILMLLLPNVYDIFTAIAILYAYFVNQETPLKIPFALACVVIYAATRVGIIAGQGIGMMSGQGIEETVDANDPDAFARKLMWGFIPQLIGVIAFQIIFAFCYLPSFPGTKSAQQPQEQVQLYEKNKTVNVQDEDSIEVKTEQETPAVADTQQNVEEPKTTDVVAVSAPEPEVAPVRRTYNTYRRYNTTKAKPVAQKQETVQETAPVNTVRYDIPERTLRVAGISPSEYNLANVRNNNTQIATTNNGAWSFSASTGSVSQTPVSTPVQTVTTTNSVSSGSSLQPKRYPGDDNPINTSWGYYRTGKWAADAERTLKNK